MSPTLRNVRLLWLASSEQNVVLPVPGVPVTKHTTDQSACWNLIVTSSINSPIITSGVSSAQYYQRSVVLSLKTALSIQHLGTYELDSDIVFLTYFNDCDHSSLTDTCSLHAYHISRHRSLQQMPTSCVQYKIDAKYNIKQLWLLNLLWNHVKHYTEILLIQLFKSKPTERQKFHHMGRPPVLFSNPPPPPMDNSL